MTRSKSINKELFQPKFSFLKPLSYREKFFFSLPVLAIHSILLTFPLFHIDSHPFFRFLLVVFLEFSILAIFFPKNATTILRSRLFILIAHIALVIATFAVTLDNGRDPREWSETWSLFRLFALLCVVAGALWTASALEDPVKRLLRMRWWAVGQTDSTKAPEWDSVLRMLCEERYDPMTFGENGMLPNGKGEIQFAMSIPNMAALTWIISIGVLYGIVLDYILYPRVPDIFLESKDIGKLADLSGNLTAFLALIAAAISIVFTYQQLRAKVRADSRQAWVTKVRELTAGVIAGLQDIVAWNIRHGDEYKKVNEQRILLELHLNPSEKDHRLLMLLIRACVIPETVVGNDAAVAKALADEIKHKCELCKKSEHPNETTHNPCYYKVLYDITRFYNSENADKSEEIYFILKTNKDIIISFIFKLSHAILKREWERVRYTR